MTDPICRLEDGTPLWLTGAIRQPELRERYWTPRGPKQRTNYNNVREWPILTDNPILPDPYLAGRIDEILMFSWGEPGSFTAQRAKDLMKQARKHLGEPSGGKKPT